VANEEGTLRFTAFKKIQFVRAFGRLVVRNRYSGDARRFQPVDEIIIPLSIQLLALMLHFLDSIKCPQAQLCP
jgi:hypothetical protein